jgi:hypothetical protein
MDKKYGVYICEGCGIGESLDVKALQGVVAEEGLAAKTQPILCSKEGVDFLKQYFGVVRLLPPGAVRCLSLARLHRGSREPA